MDLQKRLGVLGFDPKDNQISSSLEDLSKASGTAKIARIVAESRYRMLSGMDPSSIDNSIETTPGTAPGEFSALRAQVAFARSNLAQLADDVRGESSSRQGPVQPALPSWRKQLKAEQERLLTQARENFNAAKANEDQTTAALEKQKADAYKMRDDLIEYTIKQREFESSRTLYEGLLERLREPPGSRPGLSRLRSMSSTRRFCLPIRRCSPTRASSPRTFSSR